MVWVWRPEDNTVKAVISSHPMWDPEIRVMMPGLCLYM